MKTFFKYLLLLIAFAFTFSCSSNNLNVSSTNSNELLDSGNFSFQAQRANPMNMDVVNIMNNFPTTSSSRMLTLDPGYGVDFSKDSLKVNLPYFGRLFVANPNPTKNDLDFVTKNFMINKSKSTAKKAVWVIDINQSQNIQQLFLEVYKNGRAYLSVNFRDRQAISYDGYITEITPKKSTK